MIPTFSALYAAALAYLARREHSAWQLQQKLAHKFPEATETLINTVIETLARENYQSDARFASAYLESRVARGNGPKKIRYELILRGVDTQWIDFAVTHAAVDWLELKEKTRQKKFGVGPLPQDYNAKAKQLSYLQHKGF